MAEEVKIVNISMTCFSQEGDQRGLENTDLLNKSYSPRSFAHATLVAASPFLKRTKNQALVAPV